MDSICFDEEPKPNTTDRQIHRKAREDHFMPQSPVPCKAKVVALPDVTGHQFLMMAQESADSIHHRLRQQVRRHISDLNVHVLFPDQITGHLSVSILRGHFHIDPFLSPVSKQNKKASLLK